MTSFIPEDWQSTKEIKVSDRLVGQVVGQEKAVEIIQKAASQKRNVLLVGVPGTGKSLLAQAMAEILPVTQLRDILIFPNLNDLNNPIAKTVKAGEGKKILEHSRMEDMKERHNSMLLGMIIPLIWFVFAWFIWTMHWISDVIYAATLIMGAFIFLALSIGLQMKSKEKATAPKLLVDNSGKKTAPFVEATGARAGALLGDVRHDPLQSGGLGTPPHLRVEPGMLHKANNGVLFIDEIAALSMKAQQELLTAMQEKKYSITGQSEMSSGSMVRTNQVPCDFVLVASGNYNDLVKVHPALRSRIRGYGYEIYVNESMLDTPENRNKLIQFIAQEVKKDGKIPHFSKEAVQDIIFEARKRAFKKGRLTLQLRDLGGLVRAAGDIALIKGNKLVQPEDLVEAKKNALTLEQQIAFQMIEDKKLYEVYLNTGVSIGRVNGLAVLGDRSAGAVLPIEAEVAPAASKDEGRIIATGKLEEIAREAVQNVSALIKNISGKDISKHDLHIQFLQTYSGVEGDSASVSVATAVISALEKIPVRQDVAMTGSLSVRGEVLPVGGVTGKVQAAIQAGFKEVILPRANAQDIVLPEEELSKIKIVPVKTLSDVLNHALVKGKKKQRIIRSLEKIISITIKKPVVALQ